MDTIVAPATPEGRSALAVIRVSGAKCLSILKEKCSNEKPVNRKMVLGQFRDSKNSEVIDELMYVFMQGPSTYTGEDTVEFFPHGNPLLIRKILQSLINGENIRLAEPGEFTRRAFENGKVNLLQAEAVGELIHAETDAALRNAEKMQKGAFEKPLLNLKNSLVELRAFVELETDFAEEEADADISAWITKVENLKTQMTEILNGCIQMKQQSTAPKVVLFGAPNAGKSSLANALLEQDRLLVSKQAGTTRDWVEMRLHLQGGEVRLIDTAGLGQAIDELDQESMNRSRKVLESASLKILVQDGTKATENIEGDFDLCVRTRSDLSDFNSFQRDAVSCKTGKGVKELKEKMNQILFSKQNDHINDSWLFNSRHQNSVEFAIACMDRVLKGNNGQAILEPELVAFEINQATSALNSLTGEISADDVLNKIFSGFCIGK